MQTHADGEPGKARPDGIKDKDKVIIGIFESREHLVGVFDLIKNYPNPRTLTLGLMLLEPSCRGKGFGSMAYEILN